MSTGDFESPEWSTHSSGNWTETTSEGTWTATSAYVNGGSQNGGANKFGMNAANDALVTPGYTDPCDLSFYVRTSSDPDNWVMDVQTSTTPTGPWTTQSTVTENGVGGLITNTYTQINVPLNLTGTYYIRFFVVSRSAGSIFLDDISLTCGCVSNTISTGAITGAPFTVDCDVPTTDNGSIAFTSIGTFNGGNIFTAQLSDETGSFASPVNIGTLSLSGVDPSGSINFTVPAGSTGGAGYTIRIVSDDPGATSDTSAVFTVTQNGSCVPPLPSSQGLLINEWSNGPSGSQEYYEFVVAGQCGDLVDIRGYILDDNNGTFSAVFPSSSGIAQGHLRLANDPQWASIPVGSLIVIYNNAEPNASLPPDDINDSDNDSLYVIPHDNALFEITGDLPNNSLSDSTYSPVTYLSTAWSPLGLRNAGDAIQVRDPSGAYWHGVSYGGAEMTGGPNNMKISTSGMGGNCGWFTDGDYLSTANWTTGPVGGNETPGYENNAANLAWLRAMRDPTAPDCPITVLPVEIGYFIGENHGEGNVLHWNTVSEKNSDFFTIERSLDGKTWESLGTVKGAGNSEFEQEYQFVDFNYRETMNYYRLKQTDFDGTTKKHFRIVSINNGTHEDVQLVGIYNLMGQKVDKNYKGVQIKRYSDGSTQKIFNE
jgi:hypothetical protein